MGFARRVSISSNEDLQQDQASGMALPVIPESAFASSSPGLHALHRVLASNAARTSAGLQMQTLPPGWVKAGDEYLGIFYENTATGERQREHPGGAAPAAPAAAPAAAAPAASSGGPAPLPPGWTFDGDDYHGYFYKDPATGDRQRTHPVTGERDR